MNSITKEQWRKIEDEMSWGWVSMTFKYKGHELYVCRVHSSESKTVLAVYINGIINEGWGVFDSELLADPENRPDIVKEVWKKRTMAKYKVAQIKDIEKIWGKRRAKKEFPDLHSRFEWYTAYFPKASVLCRQFKKLEGLELVKEVS